MEMAAECIRVLGLPLGAAAQARVSTVHMCAHVCARGSFALCRGTASLPHPTQTGNYLGKIILEEAFSSVQHGMHPALWFSKVTAEEKEKKKVRVSFC